MRSRTKPKNAPTKIPPIAPVESPFASAAELGMLLVEARAGSTPVAIAGGLLVTYITIDQQEETGVAVVAGTSNEHAPS